MAIGKHGAVLRQLRTLFNVGTVREMTDGQLLERFATDRGEAAELAFAVLVERHGPMVMRVCRGVLADPHDTQDAFQATFLVLVKKARALWVRDSLGPWLHQVAYRTASNARSSAARRRKHERSAAASTLESRTEVPDELGRVLHEEIERLPEHYRAPVVLCDLEGRTHEQAARHLGWPVGTVKSRQARGRERLRDRLLRRGLAPNGGLLAVLRPDGLNVLVPPALLDSTTRAVVQSVAARTIVRTAAASLAQEVLTAMSITQWLKIASVLLVAGATASGVNSLAQKGAAGVESRPAGNAQAAHAYDGPVSEVKPGKLIVNVIDRGNLESSRNADIYCNVEGRTTIIWIVAEGTRVKKGDRVCELDSAALRDQLINQRITTKGAEAVYQNAKLEREEAQLADQAYREDLFPREQREAEGERRIARAELALAEAQLKATKAAPNSSDTQLIRAELDVARAHLALEKANNRLHILTSLTKDRRIKDLVRAVERAHSNELAKQAAWELEQGKERKLERQIAACILVAPSDGLVVYANDPRRSFGSNQPQIEEGATVRERQKILSIPDLSRMQVNTKIHEAWVDKLAPNMKAKIRVDAFLDQVLDGKVLDVAPLPDPGNFFSSDIKVYTTHIQIDHPLPGLRPGMTAQAEILVDERDNVLSVPVEAVLQYDAKDYVAVKKPDGTFERREVVLGISNGKFVEVKQGIRSGEQVALNAIALMSEDEKREAARHPTPPAKAKAKAKGKGARVGGFNPAFAKRFQSISPEDRARMKSASPEERIEILKKAGFTEDELEQMRNLGGGGLGRPGGGPPAKSVR